MAAAESVRQAFTRIEPLAGDVQRYVRDTLRPFCDASSYAFVDRKKTSTSLGEKLEGGRVDAWSKIDDLYACTIVVPVSSHEGRVLQQLDKSFATRTIRSRVDTQKAPDVFRFDGARWYGTVKPDAATRYQPGVGELLFEVQVVTAFEYAWIVVTHDLVYKADNTDWQRQRLAAQLKATVEQAEVVINAFDSASSVILESPWQETAAKTEVIDRMRALVESGAVPETLVPTSWRRFADNVYALVRTYERDRRKIPAAISDLVGVIEDSLTGSSPRELPASGTLFQLVVATVAAGGGGRHLRGFTVVPSRELRDLYGVTELPKVFKFDGTALSRSQPSES